MHTHFLLDKIRFLLESQLVHSSKYTPQVRQGGRHWVHMLWALSVNMPVSHEVHLYLLVQVKQLLKTFAHFSQIVVLLSSK